jgi:two-component system phosphate regulon response regulator PhoB
MTASPPRKILVIDDEADVTGLLSYNLKARGFAVEALNDPHQSMSRLRAFMPDLVILDVMMPELSGIQVCRLMRADPALKAIPVVFLTAKAEENDRIAGLESGADDYICKPFNIKELILRVQSILRRSAETAPAAPQRLQAGEIMVDGERHEATLRGKPVELTVTEFKLLALLIERRGRVQTREQLLVNVWNYAAGLETRTVDTHVRRLREKLGDHADWIETVRGVGYRLVENPAARTP